MLNYYTIKMKDAAATTENMHWDSEELIRQRTSRQIDSISIRARTAKVDALSLTTGSTEQIN